MAFDHQRVSHAVATALHGPGGVALVVRVFAGIPGVVYTPAERGFFSRTPERILIGDRRYEVTSDHRLRAAHVVHGIVIGEETLAAGAVGPHISRAIGQVVAQFGEPIVPSVDAAVEALLAGSGY